MITLRKYVHIKSSILSLMLTIKKTFAFNLFYYCKHFEEIITKNFNQKKNETKKYFFLI